MGAVRVNNRTLRICIFARTMPAHRGKKGMFYPHIIGEALSKRGSKIDVLTTALSSGVTLETPRVGMRIYYLKNTIPDRYSEKYWRRSAFFFDKLHQINKYDVVISDSASAFGFVKYSKNNDAVPLITVFHNSPVMIRSALKMKFKISSIIYYYRRIRHYTKFSANIIKPLFDKSKVIIAVAKIVGRSLAQDFPSARQKIKIIYNGCKFGDTKIDKNVVSKFKNRLRIDTEPLLLYLGRLVPEKGIDCLLDAIKLIKDEKFKALIIGYGSLKYFRRLQLKLQRYRIQKKVFIIPGVEHNDVPIYLTIADIFILPTLHWEGLPFSIVEAFKFRLPVIASHIGGIPEIVEDGINGFLVPPGDMKLLSEKIKILIRDKRLRKSFGSFGYKTVVDRFSMTNMITEIYDVLFSVVKNSENSVLP